MPPLPATTGRSSSRSSKTSDAAVVAVGEIVAAHALRGAVRVRAYHPPAPSLAAGALVVLARGDGREERRVLTAAPFRGSLVLVQLDGVTDRTAAEALVGSRVLVPVRDLPPPGEHEFYYHEIEGFEVETVSGERLGSVVEIFPTGANDVLVVRGPGGEHLIPVITDVVRTIDRAGRRIVIAPLPGLLD
jgi:16S rRNA processing protein RimM